MQWCKSLSANANLFCGFWFQDLRKFNTVTSVIDKYNHAFGPVILASVSTGIMYFSVNIFQLFRDGGDWMHKVTTFGSFFWFGIMLVTSAQVNKEVSSS